MARIALPPSDGEEGRRLWSLRPDLDRAVQAFGADLQKGAQLPLRVREAARIRIAHLNGCVPCSEARPEEAARFGLDEAFYAHVDDPARRSDYGVREGLGICFAERFVAGAETFDDALWAELNRYFAPDALLELAALCAKWMGLGRLNAVIDISQSCPIRFPAGQD